MSANSFGHNAISDLRLHERRSGSRQPSDLPALAAGASQEKAEKSGTDTLWRSDNTSPESDIQSCATQTTISFSRKDIPFNDVRGIEDRQDARKSAKKSEKLYAASTLIRWCKFNFVGAVGIAVQFAALILLKSGLHMNYLVATTIAVEAAVVHNFVWHEQFTWADRLQARPRTSGARARNLPGAFFAALKRCAAQNPITWRSLRHPSVVRFLRFNLTNGAVSIVGNLALMRVMVGQGHMNYLAANAIAIALCSLANFLVSNEWVFTE